MADGWSVTEVNNACVGFIASISVHTVKRHGQKM